MLRAGAGEDECDLAEEGFICLDIMPKSLREWNEDFTGLLSLQR